jgi:hypothetical protein
MLGFFLFVLLGLAALGWLVSLPERVAERWRR